MDPHFVDELEFQAYDRLATTVNFLQKVVEEKWGSFILINTETTITKRFNYSHLASTLPVDSSITLKPWIVFISIIFNSFSVIPVCAWIN